MIICLESIRGEEIMDSLKTSRCGDYLFEVVDNEKVRLEISRDRLARLKDKNNLYRSYSYLVPLFEEDITVKPVSRYVYYNFPTNMEALDNVRVNMGKANLDEERDLRTKITRGLISIYFLVSEGKIYNIPINPLNFVFYRDKVQAFYREDTELGEITDEWLMEFKKLLAFYLVTDSSVIPEKFDDYTISDLVGYMSQGVHRGYQLLYNCMSLGEMVELYIQERSDIKALQNFFKLSEDFGKPLDLTSDVPAPLGGDTLTVNAVTDDDIKSSDKKTKSKSTVSDKKKEKIKKQRRADDERNARKKRKTKGKTYEPNEAKRRVIEEDAKKEAVNKRKNVLSIFIIIILGLSVALLLFKGLGAESVDSDFTQVYSQLKQEIVSRLE